MSVFLSFEQPLGSDQIILTIIKIIYFRMNKSDRESCCFIFDSNAFNINVKVRGNFLALCNSPIIALHLYLTGIPDVQCVKKLITFKFFLLIYVSSTQHLLKRGFEGAIMSSSILQT